MKRAILLCMGAVAVFAAILPAIAMADSGFPPGPPATFYGVVPAGVQVGQGVVAIVINGTQTTVCGSGTVLADTDNGGAPSYVVDVVSAQQIAGCGVTGATVQFYFTPFSGHGGQMATDTTTWNGPGATNKPLTGLGATLTVRGQAPNLATDGVY